MTDYFSESEARDLIGNTIEAMSPLQSVARGTTGTVIGAKLRDEGWVVEVRWKVRPSSFLNVMIGDACLNIPRKAKTLKADLSKPDFEANAKVVSQSSAGETGPA